MKSHSARFFYIHLVHAAIIAATAHIIDGISASASKTLRVRVQQLARTTTTTRAPAQRGKQYMGARAGRGAEAKAPDHEGQAELVFAERED